MNSSGDPIVIPSGKTRAPAEGREALVQAAIELMQELPASKIPGRDVAARARVAYGLIGHHWPAGSMTLAIEAFNRLRQAWVDGLTTDPETWLNNPAAGPFFRAFRQVSCDDEFIEAWIGTDHRFDSLDLFRQMRPDLAAHTQLARWVHYLQLSAAMTERIGHRSVITRSVIGRPAVEVLNADRELGELIRAEIMQVLTG